MTEPTADDVFHEGERAVQARAGVRASAAKLGPQMIQATLDVDVAAFLGQQSFVYLATAVDGGPVWITVLAGPPGFTRPTSPTRLELHAAPAADDPVAAGLDPGPVPAGLLILDAMTRSRFRINGTLRAGADGLVLEVREAFGNCPKHISRRRPVRRAPAPTRSPPPLSVSSAELDASQRQLIRQADTFFVASRHPTRGADASHRGGRPGFVAVSETGRTLTFPDYRGNTMFQTLGNLSVDPAVGLLFIDWASGRTLQITGRAQIDWDSGRTSAWERAERLVDVAITAVVDRPSGLGVIWELVESHRLNPPVPAHPPVLADPPDPAR
jgi:predicted pyridoxine 5'-phosphate oxidase superfamily flavin-nucleotide-binding protein